MMPVELVDAPGPRGEGERAEDEVVAQGDDRGLAARERKQRRRRARAAVGLTVAALRLRRTALR
jgi:hypothetical protein